MENLTYEAYNGTVERLTFCSYEKITKGKARTFRPASHPTPKKIKADLLTFRDFELKKSSGLLFVVLTLWPGPRNICISNLSSSRHFLICFGDFLLVSQSPTVCIPICMIMKSDRLDGLLVYLFNKFSRTQPFFLGWRLLMTCHKVSLDACTYFQTEKDVFCAAWFFGKTVINPLGTLQCQFAPAIYHDAIGNRFLLFAKPSFSLKE